MNVIAFRLGVYKGKRLSTMHATSQLHYNMPRRKHSKPNPAITQAPELQAEEVELEEENPDEEEHLSTGKPCRDRDKYAYTPAVENSLVEWFSEKEEYCNKVHPSVHAKGLKKHQLQLLANKFGCDVEKIEGWFRNQRTAYGKLMKIGKSGAEAGGKTPRQLWQMKSFSFLGHFISPRTYTRETATVSTPSTSSVQNGSASDSATEEQEPQEPSTSSAAVQIKTRNSKKSTKSSDEMNKRLESLLQTQGPHEAFGNYLTQCMAKIQEERWQDFTLAALQLVNNFSKKEGAQIGGYQAPEVQWKPQPHWNQQSPVQWGQSPCRPTQQWIQGQNQQYGDLYIHQHQQQQHQQRQQHLFATSSPGQRPSLPPRAHSTPAVFVPQGSTNASTDATIPSSIPSLMSMATRDQDSPSPAPVKSARLNLSFGSKSTPQIVVDRDDVEAEEKED